MIEPLHVYQARVRAWEERRQALRESYRRPEFEIAPESWAPPDVNAAVIEQRVAAECGARPERILVDYLEPMTGKRMRIIEGPQTEALRDGDPS